MSHGNSDHSTGGFHGPKCWVVSAIVGAVLGWLVAVWAPATVAASSPGSVADASAPTRTIVEVSRDGGRTTVGESTLAGSSSAGVSRPEIPAWLCVPFGLLLGSIALMPFVHRRWWHHHYPDVALLLGAAVTAYYLKAFGGYGSSTMLHVGLEYYSFIALVGGLYVVSGGILVNVRMRGTPLTNTLLLGLGAVLANVVGTTGASVLLIRPFMRMNAGRLRPIHVVMFIIIVSNCGGCLTPIGDPPLYLGYLKGVPFFWTLTHLWPMWLVCIGLLLGLFAIIDAAVGRTPASESAQEQHGAPEAGCEVKPLPWSPVAVHGWSSVLLMGVLVAGVFVDPLLDRYFGLHGVPVGATVQLLVAAAAFVTADRRYHHANGFNFEPVKEVGLLFIGIFATMAPALGYLQAHGGRLGLENPTQFYYATGVLSAVLDNAPTYLSFLQVSFSAIGQDVGPEQIRRFIECTYEISHMNGAATTVVSGVKMLEALSLGAVFFGAMTYIGNGPNFMVKAIAEAGGVKMPSFAGYVARALAILGPVLVVIWAVFIR